MKRRLSCFEVLIILTIIGFLFAFIDLFLWQTLFILLFGWMAGIFRLLSGLVHEPVAVVIGMLALLLLPVMLHLFLRQLPTRNRLWRFRQSVGVAGVACAFIITTIALIALIHEIYWIAHPKEAMLGSDSGLYRARDMMSKNNLKQLSLSILNISDVKRGVIPSGGTLLYDGRPGHGWMTQLLPYVEGASYYDKLDLDKPWDDPVNASVYQDRPVSTFRNPKYREESDAEGYRLTWYAANELVMPFGRSLRMDDITDGTANTILCGEAAENLQPWGSPFNARDPSLGINRSPHGFGYEKPYKTVNFAMCDGSVISLTQTTDLKILRALATPNGGEKVVVP